METFEEVWGKIQSQLRQGSIIKNWTGARGYLGDEFKIVSVASSHLVVDAPRAKTIQRVSKKDFEFMFGRWDGYCKGRIARGDLVKGTRVSKYTMSILRHLSDEDRDT
jgi:hypothetical protein